MKPEKNKIGGEKVEQSAVFACKEEPQKKKKGNVQNLRVPTSEQAREYGRRGGLKTAENRIRRKSLKEALEILLEKEYETESGEKMTGIDLISLKQIEKAIKNGDTKAFEVIRDTIGQKPVERVEISDIDKGIADEIDGYVG